MPAGCARTARSRESPGRTGTLFGENGLRDRWDASQQLLLSLTRRRGKPTGGRFGNGSWPVSEVWHATDHPTVAASALSLPDQSQANSTPYASKKAAPPCETSQVSHDRQPASLPAVSEPGCRPRDHAAGTSLG